MRIIEANRVEKMTPAVWNLPCVTSAYKTMKGETRFLVETHCGNAVAKPADWIVKYEDGHWDVLTDEKYKEAERHANQTDR